MITIVNYGLGNLGSLINMFKRIGVRAHIEADPDKLAHARKILLPGVGAFDAAMRQINDITGLREVLEIKANREQVPFLGVCLGMQLLTNGSQEGVIPGLGWIDGETVRFPHEGALKVPHMGWNIARMARASALTHGLEGELRYYFVHSYYVRVRQECNSLMKTTYGVEFDSAIGRDNIFGVQFHPEKSHSYGMDILKNFGNI